MRSFVVYTLARLGLFVAVYAAIWLAIGRSVRWDSVSGLYTALIAMVVSSLIALATLRRLRNRLAADVAARARGAGNSGASAAPGGQQQPEQHSGAVPELGETGVPQDRDQR